MLMNISKPHHQLCANHHQQIICKLLTSCKLTASYLNSLQVKEFVMWLGILIIIPLMV